jgi:hypothetical protein
LESSLKSFCKKEAKYLTLEEILKFLKKNQNKNKNKNTTNNKDKNTNKNKYNM